ncbi:MAG: TetR/AcrR family transcriptional regulator [Cytophagales bacterium]|nr:TetR/AcrR family transcriptional regulator [Armatimonadota bacterium]
MKGQPKAEQRTETIRRFIKAGREIFARQGYAQAATEEIVQQVGLTRGALYHHFSSKEGLFRAVLSEVQQKVAWQVEEASSQGADPWEQLQLGCRAFLASSLDKEVQQIMLTDAPAVLGWEAWREMDAENSFRLLKEVLDVLVARGLIETHSTQALAHLLSGAMNEAALWIVRSPAPQLALTEASRTLEELLEALRK